MSQPITVAAAGTDAADQRMARFLTVKMPYVSFDKDDNGVQH